MAKRTIVSIDKKKKRIYNVFDFWRRVEDQTVVGKKGAWQRAGSIPATLQYKIIKKLFFTERKLC